jgi:hypothetical protein
MAIMHTNPYQGLKLMFLIESYLMTYLRLLKTTEVTVPLNPCSNPKSVAGSDRTQSLAQQQNHSKSDLGLLYVTELSCKSENWTTKRRIE